MIFSKICIASDHAGYKLKELIKDYLIKRGIPIIDLGPLSLNSVDYPDFATEIYYERRTPAAITTWATRIE